MLQLFFPSYSRFRLPGPVLWQFMRSTYATPGCPPPSCLSDWLTNWKWDCNAKRQLCTWPPVLHLPSPLYPPSTGHLHSCPVATSWLCAPCLVVCSVICSELSALSSPSVQLWNIKHFACPAKRRGGYECVCVLCYRGVAWEGKMPAQIISRH